MLHVDIDKLHDNIIMLCVDIIYIRYMAGAQKFHHRNVRRTTADKIKWAFSKSKVITDKIHEPKIAIIKLEINNKWSLLKKKKT